MTIMRHDHGSRVGVALVWSAVLACPCHWPLLVVGLLGTTALGAALKENFVSVFAAAALYFAFALTIGFWLVRRSRHAAQSCPQCQGL